MTNLVYDVQRYYRQVAPFFEAELADRGDDALWRQIGWDHRLGHVLEIGCGSGRVTALLATEGACVVGIDLSPELLCQARRALAGSPARLLLADVRRLALRSAFDAIVAADDPFSHLTRSLDRDAALAGIAAHLAPGGVFVLDALWFPGRPQRTREHDVTLNGRLVHVTEHWRCDLRTHRCATEFDYDTGSGEPTQARFEARYWTAAEVDRRLARAGLQVTHRWGGYDRRPWDARTSERLVIEAQVRGR